MKPKAKQSPDAPSKKVKNPRNKKPPTLGLPQIRNTRSTRVHREKSVPLEKQLDESKQVEQVQKDVEDAFTAICASPAFFYLSSNNAPVDLVVVESFLVLASRATSTCIHRYFAP